MIFIAENMASVKLSSLLRSARFVDANGDPATIGNGSVVVLGALEPNEREVHTAAAVSANTDPIVVVDAPELEYREEITRGLDDYINPAGIVVRTRKLVVGDTFAVSEDAITPIGAAPVVGGFIATPAAGTLWAEVANANGAQSVICQIKESYVLGNDPLGGRNITMYSVEVIVA